MKIKMPVFLRIIVSTFTLGNVLLTVYAQDIPLNGLRNDDKYTQYQIAFADTASKGFDKIWNLSEAAVGDASKVEISLLDDSLKIFQIMRHGERSVTYLRQRPDTIAFMGFENNLWKVDFANGLAFLRDKSHTEGAETDSLRGQGMYCGRFRYLLSGCHTLCCDASGMLILPEGDTIRNVNRLHSVQTFTHRFLNGDMDDLGTLQLDSRRWYAPGYRYPVVESQTLSRLSTGAVLLRNAFYTPLSEIEALTNDVDNIAIREQNKAKLRCMPVPDINDETHSGLLSGGDDIRYSFTHDKAGQTVSIRFVSSHAKSVEFILSDIMGIVYASSIKQCQPGEDYTLTIPYGSIPGSGSYVLYISTEENRYAEKFHK